MHNCALKTPLYSNFALSWRCDTMEYSSILLADDIVGRYHLEQIYENLKDLPYIHHDSTIINPQDSNALIHLKPNS